MDYISKSTLVQVRKQEKREKLRVKNKAFLAAMTAFLTCFFVHATELFVPLPIASLVADAVEHFGLPDDTVDTISGIILTLIYFGIPFGAANIIFKLCFRDNDGYVPLHRTPKNPFLFVFGAIGFGYLLNLICSIMFKSFFERFPTEDEVLPTSTLGIILTFVQIAVLPALIEEWAFRGTILKYLLPYGKKGAIIISSLIFGLMHIDPARVIFATVFGCILGICYEYTRSIKLTVLIHFLNNSFSVAAQYSENSIIAAVVFGLIFYAILIIGIVAVIYYAIKGYKHKKISVSKPLFAGRKLTVGQYLFAGLVNPGAFMFLISYIFIFWLIYFIN